MNINCQQSQSVVGPISESRCGQLQAVSIGESRRGLESCQHALVLRNTFSHNVKCRAMRYVQQNIGQANVDRAGSGESYGLDDDLTLVMEHRHHGVVAAFNRLAKHGVRRDRPIHTARAMATAGPIRP